MRRALVESLQVPAVATPDYSMKAEAVVAEKSGFTKLAAFLRSSTQMTECFDLNKLGRMKFYSIIQDKILGRRLSHTKEGSGRAGILIVRKKCFDDISMEELGRLEERRSRHGKLLAQLFRSSTKVTAVWL